VVDAGDLAESVLREESLDLPGGVVVVVRLLLAEDNAQQGAYAADGAAEAASSCPSWQVAAAAARALHFRTWKTA